MELWERTEKSFPKLAQNYWDQGQETHVGVFTVDWGLSWVRILHMDSRLTRNESHINQGRQHPGSPTSLARFKQKEKREGWGLILIRNASTKNWSPDSCEKSSQSVQTVLKSVHGRFLKCFNHDEIYILEVLIWLNCCRIKMHNDLCSVEKVTGAWQKIRRILRLLQWHR